MVTLNPPDISSARAVLSAIERELPDTVTTESSGDSFVFYDQRAPRQAAGHEVIDTGFDYTSPDLLMPYPFYAPMHWVCVVNPGKRSQPDLADLMRDAHALARARYRTPSPTDSGDPGH